MTTRSRGALAGLAWTGPARTEHLPTAVRISVDAMAEINSIAIVCQMDPAAKAAKTSAHWAGVRDGAVATLAALSVFAMPEYRFTTEHAAFDRALSLLKRLNEQHVAVAKRLPVDRVALYEAATALCVNGLRAVQGLPPLDFYADGATAPLDLFGAAEKGPARA